MTQALRSGALISDDQQYRYALWRIWDIGTQPLIIVMLNPSTADAEVDDPTIRRCVGFAKRDGYGGIVVVNLFAFRSPSPADLKTAADPVGPENRATLLALLDEYRTSFGPPDALLAWGACGTYGGAHTAMRDLLTGAQVRALCLGTTKDGHPRHPLYVRADAPLIPV